MGAGGIASPEAITYAEVRVVNQVGFFFPPFFFSPLFPVLLVKRTEVVRLTYFHSDAESRISRKELINNIIDKH